MKIDKNVPLPATPLNSIVGTLKQMNVGDSIVIPTNKMDSWRTRAAHMGLSIISRSISATERRMWIVAKKGAKE